MPATNLNHTAQNSSKKTILGRERRTEPRFPINISANVRVVYPADEIERKTIRIVDVSANGLRFVCSLGMFVGSTVQIEIGPSTHWAQVRNCVVGPDGFEIGVQVDETYIAEGPTTLRRRDG